MPEFVCIDCDYVVYQFGVSQPDPPRCAVCQTLAEMPDSEREAARKILFREDTDGHGDGPGAA